MCDSSCFSTTRAAETSPPPRHTHTPRSTLASLSTRLTVSESHIVAIVVIVERWAQNRFSKVKGFKGKKNLKLNCLDDAHRKLGIHYVLVKLKRSENNQYDKQTFMKGFFAIKYKFTSTDPQKRLLRFSRSRVTMSVVSTHCVFKALLARKNVFMMFPILQIIEKVTSS